MRGIELKGVSKSYKGTVALWKSNVQIEHGKIYGLLGRNGAGKTTLLKLISHHIFSDEGQIFIEDEVLDLDQEMTRKIYFMGEDDLYPNSFKVMDVFKCTQAFYPTFDFEKALELCKAFELNPKKRIKSLSTGYRTIYKIITALCVHAPYVFLDEPVLGLDAHHRALFYKCLLKTYSEQSNTYVLSTHLIEEISGMVEDVIILKQGHVLLEAKTEKLLEMSYTVRGTAREVDDFLIGKKPLFTEEMGTLKVAYLMDPQVNRNIPDTLQHSALDLQSLFVALTSAEGGIQ